MPVLVVREVAVTYLRFCVTTGQAMDKLDGWSRSEKLGYHFLVRPFLWAVGAVIAIAIGVALLPILPFILAIAAFVAVIYGLMRLAQGPRDRRGPTIISGTAGTVSKGFGERH